MSDEKPEIKFCRKCQRDLAVSNFHKDKTQTDGLCWICINCKKEYRNQPANKQREKALEAKPSYRERKRRYQTSDRGKHQESFHRHSKRSMVDCTLSLIEWSCILILQNNRCAICMEPFGDVIQPTKDCIVPISSGGSLTFDNTQALCRHCNAVKHTRLYSGLGNRWRSTLRDFQNT